MTDAAQSLAEASFAISAKLDQYTVVCGRRPVISGIHSISPWERNVVSIWLHVDADIDAEAIVWCLVAEHAVLGYSHDMILDALTSDHGTRH